MKRLLTLTMICAMAALGSTRVARAQNGRDDISGQWYGAFSAQGTTAAFSLTLKLDAGKVTGTIASEHTGPGTVINGEWKNGVLAMTLKFEKHESIALTGKLANGKLAGEFKTEGFTSNWEAGRKKPGKYLR